MTSNSLPSTFIEFRAPAILRGQAIFGLIISIVLTFISFMAWWAEGALIGLLMLPAWLAMGVYWAWQWYLLAQRIHLYPDRLLIYAPLNSPNTIDYTQIIALNMGQGVVQIITKKGHVQIRGETNTLAALTATLERTVPALIESGKQQPALPIIVNAPHQSILWLNLFGLLIGGMGVALISTAIADAEFEDRGFAIAFGLLMLCINGVFLHWLLVTFVWQYRFTADEISIRHAFSAKRYDPQNLKNIEIRQRKVTHRGVTRTLYTLEMQFLDSSQLTIEPGSQNYPLAYAEKYEKVLLDRLLVQLKAVYQPDLQPNHVETNPAVMAEPLVTKSHRGEDTAVQTVTRSELDPANLPWNDVETPDFAFQLYSQPADLRVLVLNYGERQPGAETIHIRLSSPIENEDWFETTNGNAMFSPSGRLLLLHDTFLPIVVDSATKRAWHFRIEERTFLLDPYWEGEILTGRTLGYGKPMQDAEPWGPWEREEISRQWQPGFGKWSKIKPQLPPTTESIPITNRQRRSHKGNITPTSPGIPDGMSEQLWRKLNFIEMNPDWVMLGDGSVFAAQGDYSLPRQHGEHVVGGKIQLLDEEKPSDAVFVMDATSGGVAAVYLRRNGQWQRISEALEWMRPHVNFAGFAVAPPDEDTH